jgi:hypothetical protein
LTEGKGDFGGAMLPPPEGVWGMPADMLKTLPGKLTFEIGYTLLGIG